MSKIFFLSLGSNLENRLQNLKSAVKELNSKNIRVTNCSAIYETSPVDCESASPSFLNAAIKVKTDFSPEVLIDKILEIEKKIGRERSTINAPRIIDIDVLLSDNLISDNPKIIIPHPRMHERFFVLEPLKEIAGENIHPVFKKSINQLYIEAKKTSTEKIKLFAPVFSILPVLAF